MFILDSAIDHGAQEKIRHLHYFRMLLTRYYNHTYEETVCDALITNRDVKNHQKRYKTIAMAEPSNTIHILVVCAI